MPSKQKFQLSKQVSQKNLAEPEVSQVQDFKLNKQQSHHIASFTTASSNNAQLSTFNTNIPDNHPILAHNRGPSPRPRQLDQTTQHKESFKTRRLSHQLQARVPPQQANPHYYSNLKKLVSQLNQYTSQDKLNEVLNQFNNFESICQTGDQYKQSASLNFGVGLREQRSDNIVHFQDPRSAKFSGQLNKPMKKTENKRNDTSYNFIKGGDAKKAKQDKFGKKVMAHNISPMKAIIQAEPLQDENRAPYSSLHRYLAKQLDSNRMQELVFKENHSSVNNSIALPSSRRSPQRDFIDSSGISCLPGSYKKQIKDQRESHSSLALYRKTIEGKPLDENYENYSCNMVQQQQNQLKKSVSLTKLRSNLSVGSNYYTTTCQEPQILSNQSTTARHEVGKGIGHSQDVWKQERILTVQPELLY